VTATAVLQEHPAEGVRGHFGTRPGHCRHLRILIVEPREVVRCGFRFAFAREPSVARCLTASSGTDALTLASRFEPHVALVTLRPGSREGVEVSRRLVAEHPTLSVLLLADHTQVSPAAVIEAKALGSVDGAEPLADLFAAVARAAAGRPPSRSRPTRTSDGDLSERERAVLRHMASGATNREIATRLHLSPNTIKQHTRAVFRKLEVRNRTEAVRLAERFGLVG
jgi:DNA-binding NarL/FixJ family response regulator